MICNHKGDKKLLVDTYWKKLNIIHIQGKLYILYDHIINVRLRSNNL
jgi:hypothetical protein